MSELIQKLQLSWDAMVAKHEELTLELENLREDNLVLEARHRCMMAQIQNLQDDIHDLEVSMVVECVSTD